MYNDSIRSYKNVTRYWVCLLDIIWNLMFGTCDLVRRNSRRGIVSAKMCMFAFCAGTMMLLSNAGSLAFSCRWMLTLEPDILAV